MKKSILSVTLMVVTIMAPCSSFAFENKAVDSSRELKKLKKEIQEIKEKYYSEKPGQVLGGDSSEKSYYVQVNTSLPVVSLKQLNKMLSSGKNAPSGGHSRSQFSQGGCDSAVKGICTSH